LREAQSEVKALMDLASTMTWEERCQGLQRHYQVLCREYKKQEKRLVECQKKQLEVSVEGLGVGGDMGKWRWRVGNGDVEMSG